MSPLVLGGIPLLRRSGVWNLSCMILSCPRSCQETDTVSCPNTSTLWIIPVLRLTREEGYDPMHKVRPIIDLFNIRCADLYKHKQHLSVDEAMIPFKGRHFTKQYMPNKPDKFGFKVWVCAEADTGYALQVEVYVGKAGDPDRARLRSEHGTGYDIVTQLTRQYWEKFHVIYYDRFFSSVALAENLLEHKTYVNSAIMLIAKVCELLRRNRLNKTDPLYQYCKDNLL